MLSRWFDVNDDVSARVFAISLTTKLPSTYKYFYNEVVDSEKTENVARGGTFSVFSLYH